MEYIIINYIKKKVGYKMGSDEGHCIEGTWDILPICPTPLWKGFHEAASIFSITLVVKKILQNLFRITSLFTSFLVSIIHVLLSQNSLNPDHNLIDIFVIHRSRQWWQ